MTAAHARAAAGVMLAESDSLVRALPGLLDELSEADRQRLRLIGRDKPLETGQFVWQQGDGQTGIYLIRSGRIRSYYVAPSGREVTLAYWFAGNFVGGPEIFGMGVHLWSGVATSNCSVVQLPGKTLRSLVQQVISVGRRCWCGSLRALPRRRWLRWP